MSIIDAHSLTICPAKSARPPSRRLRQLRQRQTTTTWQALIRNPRQNKEKVPKTLQACHQKWLLCLNHPKISRQRGLISHAQASTKGRDILANISDFDTTSLSSTSSPWYSALPSIPYLVFILIRTTNDSYPPFATSRQIAICSFISNTHHPSSQKALHSNHLIQHPEISHYGPPNPPQQRRPHPENCHPPTRARAPRPPPLRPTPPSLPQNPANLPPPNRRRARQHRAPLPPVHAGSLDVALPRADELGQRLSRSQY